MSANYMYAVAARQTSQTGAFFVQGVGSTARGVSKQRRALRQLGLELRAKEEIEKVTRESAEKKSTDSQLEHWSTKCEKNTCVLNRDEPETSITCRFRQRKAWNEHVARSRGD